MLSELPAEMRRVASTVMIESFLRGFSRVAKMHPRAEPRRHGVEHIKDLRYAPGTTTRHHLLDVWRPIEPHASPDRPYARPWPIVLYVHGGAFSLLSKDTHWVMALAFARRGCTVFNVSYRLAPKHRYPAAIEDVCNAFGWIAENAASFGGDLDRVILAGESAGANLVTSLALALSYERPEPFARRVYATGIRPRAVIPACGFFQVTDAGRFKRDKPHLPSYVARRISDIERSYLGKGPWPHGLDLADPLVVVERGVPPSRPLPPFFLPVGTRDPLLPDTRRLGRGLRALGGVAVERYYPGEIHAFHALVMRERARSCWRDMYAFLDRHVPVMPER
jgi:acetyl esterase